MSIDFGCAVRSAGDGWLRPLLDSSRANDISVVVVASEADVATHGARNQVEVPRHGGDVRVVPIVDWHPGSRSPGPPVVASGTYSPVRCRPENSWADVAFDEWVIGDLPVLLSDASTPLIVDLLGASAPLPYRGLHALTIRHPTLVVVLEVNQAVDVSILLVLLAACPMIMLSTRGLNQLQLRRVISDLGPGRLLFGSGYPTTSQADALRSLENACTGPDDFERITKANGSYLLEGRWHPWM